MKLCVERGSRCCSDIIFIRPTNYFANREFDESSALEQLDVRTEGLPSLTIGVGPDFAWAVP